MEAALRSLQPVMEQVIVTFRERLGEILSTLTTAAAVADVDLLPGRRRGQLGRPKRCSVCRLEGARNDAALPRAHTQEDHRRWKEDAQVAPSGRRRLLHHAA